MNKEQKRDLDKLYEKLIDINAEIDEIRDAEEEKYDNLPESLQSSPNGDAINEAYEALDEISSDLNDAIEKIEELLNS